VLAEGAQILHYQFGCGKNPWIYALKDETVFSIRIGGHKECIIYVSTAEFADRANPPG
jgi:hypothetical protein